MKKNKIINSEYQERLLSISGETETETFNRIEIDPKDINKNRDLRKEKHGKNNLVSQKLNYAKAFFEGFIEPFNILLLLIGIAEVVLYIVEGQHTSDMVAFILIFAMIFLAVTVDFIQEVKTYKINLKLLDHVKNKCHILKNNYNLEFINNDWIKNNTYELEQDEITVGDLVYLNIGDVIPADSKIIWSENFTVNESSLTGESSAVFKSKEFQNAEDIISLNNIIYAESVVVTGKCIAIVINCGETNYASAILKMSLIDESESDFEIGLKKITKIILIMMGCMFPVILIISGMNTGNWTTSSIFALSILVALTPEALPAIISGNLQIGSTILYKHNVVVKNFNVVQNLGSVNVLTTDKTGTLTVDEIKLNKTLDINGEHNEHLCELLYMNSFYQSSVTNLIDRAVIEYGEEHKVSINKYNLIQEEAFSFSNRSVSVVLEHNNEFIQITKGSCDEMLNMITQIHDGSGIRDIKQNDIEKIQEIISDYSKKGFRTIIIAKRIANDKVIKNGELIFEGVALFEEKLKEGIKDAVKLIYQNDIDFKILTGDSKEVAETIANIIDMKNIKSITGLEMKQDTVIDIIEANVLSKLSPLQKGDVIDLLKEKQKVTAFLGDGVNDALALSKADVGISVNNATPIAKASADVIMLEKDLKVLDEAFMVGRKTFTNAMKFIKINLSTNIGLMLTLIIATCWFKFNAMTNLQLLIQNIIYDFSNLFYILDNVDDVSTKKPKTWNIKSFIPFAVWNGLISVTISIVNFTIIGYGMNLFDGIDHDLYKQQLFQSYFFLESFITHIVLVLVLRTERISFIKSFPNYKMVLGFLGLTTIAVILVFTPYINSVFGFVELDPIWISFMAGLVIGTWMIAETSKITYKKIFKTWF